MYELDLLLHIPKCMSNKVPIARAVAASGFRSASDCAYSRCTGNLGDMPRGTVVFALACIFSNKATMS